MASCGYIKASGEACKAMPMKGEGWCYTHHPEHAEKRKRLGSKGGKRGGRGRPQVALTDIKSRLSELADDVLEGRVDRSDAAVVSQVLNVYLRAIGMELKVKEVTELEERLEELESSLERRNKGQGYGA